MSSRRFGFHRFPALFVAIGTLAIATAAVLALINCGNTTVKGMFNGQTGSVSVSVTDPPSCAAPNGDFEAVFITIRSVQAHISSNANDNSPGWQELAPQLNSNPRQLNLLALPAHGACLLAQLGSTSALPAGDYQQIRLLLVANNPTSGAVPSTNACAGLGQVFNCVQTKSGVFHELDLSSEADTGLKVPPGQILGGPIHVAPGQDVDINIDFNACASIVPVDGIAFRLKPALTAGVVSASTGISGSVIDSVHSTPITGAMVALEQADSSVDRIKMQAATDSNGNFNFCLIPQTSVFDVVIDAINGSVAYNATVVLNVPGGAALGNIPLVAETGTATGPGTITGFVTALNGTTGASIDATISALQAITLLGGGSRQITIPLEHTSTARSTPNLAIPTTPATACPAGSPTAANCAQYTLIVPASNPSVDTFSNDKVSFSPPPSGDVLYSVEADATKPMTSPPAPICSPSSVTVNQDTVGNSLKVTAGGTVTTMRIDFSGCS